MRNWLFLLFKKKKQFFLTFQIWVKNDQIASSRLKKLEKNTFLTFWNNFVNLLILKKKKEPQKCRNFCRKFFSRWCWWPEMRCTWPKLKKKSNLLTTRKANQYVFDDMWKIHENIEKVIPPPKKRPFFWGGRRSLTFRQGLSWANMLNSYSPWQRYISRMWLYRLYFFVDFLSFYVSQNFFHRIFSIWPIWIIFMGDILLLTPPH